MILRERLFLWFPVAQRLRRTFGHQAGIGIRAAPVRFASGPYRRISGPDGPAGLAPAPWLLNGVIPSPTCGRSCCWRRRLFLLQSCWWRSSRCLSGEGPAVVTSVCFRPIADIRRRTLTASHRRDIVRPCTTTVFGQRSCSRSRQRKLRTPLVSLRGILCPKHRNLQSNMRPLPRLLKHCGRKLG